MADVRSLLRQQQASRRITHPHALYSDTGKLACSLCRDPVKTEALWDAHLRSGPHRAALRALAAARATAATDNAAEGRAKRKLDDDDGDDPEESAPSGKRARVDAAAPPTPLTASASSGASEGTPTRERASSAGSRASNTPSQGVEINMPSRPATPMASRVGSGSASGGGATTTAADGEGGKGRPDAAAGGTTERGKVDEAEWAAFEAEMAAVTAPYAEDAVISAEPVPAGGVAEDAVAEKATGRGAREAEIEGEKEDAERAMEDEFVEMEELEARATRLKERREALRARASRAELNPPAGPPQGAAAAEKGLADKENAQAGDEDEDEEEEDDEDDYAWGGLRYAGRV